MQCDVVQPGIAELHVHCRQARHGCGFQRRGLVRRAHRIAQQAQVSAAFTDQCIAIGQQGERERMGQALGHHRYMQAVLLGSVEIVAGLRERDGAMPRGGVWARATPMHMPMAATTPNNSAENILVRIQPPNPSGVRTNYSAPVVYFVMDSPPQRADWTIDQGWDQYTAAEHAVWKTLFERQAQAAAGSRLRRVRARHARAADRRRPDPGLPPPESTC